MEANIELDKVLDLVMKHQEALAAAIDKEPAGYQSQKVLWVEYKRVSKLYDDIRRAAK